VGSGDFMFSFCQGFHCKLNFIEQCWGFSKCLYHQFLAILKEVDLKCNLVTALDSVPLKTMQQSVIV